MVLLAGFGAAVAYGIAMVLQHRGASRVDPALALRPRLVAGLLRQPAWLLGLGANLVAFTLRAVALDRGSLAVVQPLVLSGIVFALAFDAVGTGRRIAGEEAMGAVAAVVGLSLFLAAASPTTGLALASARSWLVLAAWLVPVVVGAVVVARCGAGAARARRLALAGGLLAATTAALVKQTVAAAADGRASVLSSWSPYAFIVVTAVGVVVSQSAFQAGELRASLPVLSVVEPVASIAIGVTVFRERLAASALDRSLSGGGLLLLLAGVVVLTRYRTPPGGVRLPGIGHDGSMETRRRIAVVPAFNEESTVAAVLDRLAPLVAELVIVDDGSVDGTRAAIEACLPRHPNVRLLAFDANRGMSAAYYAAFRELRDRLAAGALSADDLVFTVDADGQHDLSVLEELDELARAEHLDALLVRRDLSSYPALKRAGNFLLSAWASIWAGRRLDDVESGYRVFRLGPLCDALDYYEGHRYSETVEVAVVMCRLGYHVRNDILVPVPVYRSRTTLRDAAIDLAAIPAAAWRVRRRRLAVQPGRPS